MYVATLTLKYSNKHIFVTITAEGGGQEGFGADKYATVSSCAFTANADLVIVRKLHAHCGDCGFLKICVRILGIIAQISRYSKKAQS